MRKIITILMIILLTGCSCNYELLIQDDKIIETLKVNGVTSEIPINADLSNFSGIKYQKTIDNNVVTYSANHSFNGYKKSTLLTCFDNYNITNNNDTYIIETGNEFKCYPYQYSDYGILSYDQLEIKIKTNYKVINHNATKVENDNYYWYINENNVDNAKIYFEIQKINNNNNYIIEMIVFISVILLSIVILYFIVKSKSEKNNEL